MIILLQILINIITIYSIIIIGEKNKNGFIIGAVANTLWAILFILLKAYLLLITSLICYGVYYVNYKKWKIEEK